MKDSYYDILEVSSSATAEEIKAAYRRLALKYHPDRNQDKEFSDNKMKELNFVYSILSNPERRKWYDSSRYFDTSETKEDKRYNQSYSFIFCDEIEVADSLGNTTKLKTGDFIYYLVEIDKSVITWKYKSKEYFSLIVKNIFDPNKKDDFGYVMQFDYNKTPLCTAHWGNSELIVYKEDFETYWISQSTYARIDKRKGIITGAIVLIMFVITAYYFYNKFSISPNKAQTLKSRIERNEKYYEEQAKFFQTEYFATEREVTYLLSDFYLPCTKDTTKTKTKVDLLNIPDKSGIVNGEVAKDKIVIVLLYCPSKNGYKIKYNEIIGWVSGSALENPKCSEDYNEN